MMKKKRQKEAKKQRKQTMKEMYFRCKESCVCGSKICDAAQLKECSNCHDIMKSICSKNACKVDGSKPIIITPAAASNAKQAFKKKMLEENESDDNLSIELRGDEEDLENSDSDRQ